MRNFKHESGLQMFDCTLHEQEILSMYIFIFYKFWASIHINTWHKVFICTTILIYALQNTKKFLILKDEVKLK